MERCGWCKNGSEKMIRYHDTEWGVPVHDDQKLFEFLVLEAMQCGLSWNLILEKREILRACFDAFDYEKIAAYTEDDEKRILAYPGMIRSPRKVHEMVQNARQFLAVIGEFGSFDRYLWRYSEGKTILYAGHQTGDVPSKNELSARISRDLKKRGFQYLGPVVVYSFLQACGVINDHCERCFRYGFLNGNYPTVRKEEHTAETL